MSWALFLVEMGVSSSIGRNNLSFPHAPSIKSWDFHTLSSIVKYIQVCFFINSQLWINPCSYAAPPFPTKTLNNRMVYLEKNEPKMWVISGSRRQWKWFSNQFWRKMFPPEHGVSMKIWSHLVVGTNGTEIKMKNSWL